MTTKDGTITTPLRTVRKKCIDCRGYEPAEVRNCDFESCPLHGLRMGRGSRTVLRPIRSFCVWCCNGQRAEVRMCPATRCPLWQYRLGRRPQTTRLMPEIGARKGVFGTERERRHIIRQSQVLPAVKHSLRGNDGVTWLSPQPAILQFIRWDTGRFSPARRDRQEKLIA